MAQATTFNIGSNREDVLQGFTMVEPEATPMLSMLKKGRAPKASYTEWVVDDLSDPVLTAVEEGSDVTSFANPGVNRARIGNHVQRQDRSWSVSDLEELVEDAAVANQVATAKSKKLIELRRDMASVIGSDQANQAGGGGSGAAKCRGMGQWVNNTAQTNNPVPASFLTPAASINTTAAASFAESDVNGVLESIYSQTGTLENFKLFAGTSLKKEFSDFSRTGGSNGVYRVNEDVSTNKITRNVLRYEGDFGTLPVEGHIEALKALAREVPELDLDRVGVFGWSFGGYFSARAVLARPDFYKAAVAGAPPVDWLDYDTAYTERYLGIPDPAVPHPAYERSSLVPLAKKPLGPGEIARPLLVVHGTADDNVHFKNSLVLADAMLRGGRPFELVPLVGTTHMLNDPALAIPTWSRMAAFLRTHVSTGVSQ